MNRGGRSKKVNTTLTPPATSSLNRGKNEWYVVYEGREPGIYDNWEDANAQVCGFSGNCHRGFNSYAQALKSWVDHLGKPKGGHSGSGGGDVEGQRWTVDNLAKQLDGLNVRSSRGSIQESLLIDLGDGMNHRFPKLG